MLRELRSEVGRDFGSSFVTRSCISRAALLVNVTPRIFPGAMPLRIRCAMRQVMTRVLPVPAPARIKTGPLMVSTASRCCGFSLLRSNMRARSLVLLARNASGVFTGLAPRA